MAWTKANRRLLLLIYAVVCIVACLTYISQLENGKDSFAPPFALWLAAFVAYWAAHLGPRADLKDGVSDLRQMLLVLLISIVGVLLRAWQLGSIPFSLSGDEASQGLESLRIISGEITNPFTTGWLGVPTMGFYLAVPPIHWFGQTATALRLPWMLVGGATIPLTFLFMRRIGSQTVALVSTALVATYHFHIHYSRVGSNQIGDPFFLTAALWLLYRAVDRRRILDWVWVGAVVGLAFYFYAGARLTICVVFVCCLLSMLRHPRQAWIDHSQGVLRAIGAFVIVFAPMLQYAIRFPDTFNARINQVGIIQNGWLFAESAETQQSILQLLFDQFQRATLAFHFYPDRTIWYGLRKPLLDPLFGVALIAGMVLAIVASRKNPRYLALLVWWWAAMILGGMLTESPPSTQRLITLAVPTCGLIAIALDELTDTIRSLVPISKSLLLLGAVLLFAGFSFNTYFIQHSPQRISGGKRAEFATMLVADLEMDSAETTVYFIGAPWMYWGFATLPYLLPDVNGITFGEEAVSTEQLRSSVPGSGRLAYIVAVERIQELDVVQSVYPNGELIEYHAMSDGSSLGVLYIVANLGETQ